MAQLLHDVGADTVYVGLEEYWINPNDDGYSTPADGSLPEWYQELIEWFFNSNDNSYGHEVSGSAIINYIDNHHTEELNHG